MAANPQTALSGLARALIQHGRLSEADAIACTKSAAAVPNGFILELAQRKLLNTKAVAWFAAETFGYPLLDISSVDRASIPRDAIDRKLMAKHQVVALGKRQNRLTVATADPSNMRALDEIRFQTGMQVDLIVVEADRLARLAEALSESTEDTLKDLTGEEFDMDLLQDQEATEQASEDASAEAMMPPSSNSSRRS